MYNRRGRYSQRRPRGGGRRGQSRRPPQRRTERKKERLGQRIDIPRELVLPGDVVYEGTDKRAGSGTYRDGDKVYATQLGIKAMYSEAVAVIPLKSKYIPVPGDVVIGKVVDVTFSGWLVDIYAPYPAPLSSDETPWDISFGEAGNYLNIGDLVIVKVTEVDAARRIKVSMKGPGLKKISGGMTIVVSHSKVPRIIGKGGSMIKMIKEYTNCRIIVGQNGLIWLDGDHDALVAAGECIRMIENETQALGLTEKIASFLNEWKSRKVN